MLILNWVCHANVTNYRNYSLIWHTCLENPELTGTWLRNYGSKKKVYVDFEPGLPLKCYWLQELQPYLTHMPWKLWPYSNLTTELQVKKKMYVDFEALRASIIWRLQKLQPEMKHSFWHRSDYGTTGRKKNVCWFRNPNTASRIWRLYKLQPKMKQSCHGL